MDDLNDVRATVPEVSAAIKAAREAAKSIWSDGGPIVSASARPVIDIMLVRAFLAGVKYELTKRV